MRYFFHIGYLGTNYSGWQKHPDGLSVQQVLESALSKIFKSPVYIVGCGRTDAQVHASQFFFQADIEQSWDFDLLFRLNNVLPDDIAVFDIIPVAAGAHARFDATARSYDYFIHTDKDPFLSGFSAMYPVKNWDLNAMQRAAQLLLKYNDYHAFCTMPDRNTHTICNVTAANIYTDAITGRIRFHISANRFLGKMVRIITGKLIDIATGKLSVEEFESHLVHPKKTQVIKPAYPQGLYLSKVVYPYLDTTAGSKFSELLAGNAADWQAV
ncbi:tRNA pseudouridine(38-40) synthase TruA [Mucilaginibacter glaciei]|uniref:tRNA pseudouridine synthase A n=1 Tax=Mucilaginibacter glaciei TaxID=2772109 RepID=A0A926NKA4_9SPHI|nr:tRNA pseudouridine(38-40) synthase TruA [Mucilaginibacter glaciei]MBD1392796.1 tRNA pseudouridine(38-40) synthase TruA [Mucilaginibacter glaciei]